ncbi:MAG: DUF1330 domain-containing protein [Candidatus Acidiferrum sp.]
MKANYKLGLAVLVGSAVGIAGTVATRAQQVKTPAYVIAEVEVTNPTEFKKYAEQVPGTLTGFDGHYLVRGGKIHAVEGEAPKRIVVIAFGSAEQAQAWEDSPAYGAIKPIRQGSAKSRIYIAEGLGQ